MYVSMCFKRAFRSQRTMSWYSISFVTKLDMQIRRALWACIVGVRCGRLLLACAVGVRCERALWASVVGVRFKRTFLSWDTRKLCSFVILSSINCFLLMQCESRWYLYLGRLANHGLAYSTGRILRIINKKSTHGSIVYNGG